MISPQPQSVVVQSGENTCGPACAANMAQNLGYNGVTESSLTNIVGTNNTTAPSLANALEQSTGQSFTGGAISADPAALSDSQIQGVVNTFTNNGQNSFMTLFNAPGSGLNDGHWVLVNGVDSGGNILITDPVGLNYSQIPSGFAQAWKYGVLVTH